MRALLTAALIGLMACSAPAQARKPAPPQPRVKMVEGKLQITPEENGDRIVDFSHAGYAGGNQPIPTAPARVLVRPVEGDATAIIQAAIEQVGRLPADENGFRGAVLLTPGEYTIHGQIRLDRSGVVLRGSGVDQTILIAAGYDRRPLIRLGGDGERIVETGHAITDAYVPAGSTTVTAPGHGLRVGDTVIVTRPCTDEWTVAMKMDDFGGDRHGPRWNANSRVLVWDRTVAAVDGDAVTLDVPITFALHQEFGGGTIARYTFPQRVTQAGIENLTCRSTFDHGNPADEDHSWVAIVIDAAADVWVRRVDARHFVDSAVAVHRDATRVTVEECRSFEPVGEIGGWRRRAFLVEGQQVLMQRLWSENARNDFAVGFTAAGPNAFVECHSSNSHGPSGAIDSWAAGALFDRVRIDGGNLSLRNLAHVQQGAGWSAVNSVLWNSSAGVIECWSPPMAHNYAVGTRGEFSGDGVWWSSDDGADIDSLYYAQLAARLGPDAAAQPRFLPSLPDGSRRSTPEMSARLVELTRQPAKTMREWISEIAAADPLPVATDGLAVVDSAPTEEAVAASKVLSLRNGWLVAGDEVVTGGQMGVPWWGGRARPPHVRDNPAITRFVPGKEGPGFTDRLGEMVDRLAERGIGAIVQHPPLWYERRRDDHQRVRRSDADVVAPFYEWPFARSGQGRAYDGLSKWDLTRPNQYYYLRLREFADHASRRGLVLINEHYMQHNILEAGAHYTDFPWRPANNVNDTGLPEPIAYAGDKLIYLGELFYDVAGNSKLRELHRQYIRTQLEQLKDAPNVIHQTSQEYTGSLAFMQFWLDTIAEWERETGRDVIVSLSATKDVQDAILADPQRSAAVSVIDIQYWWYQPDGTAYAPPGGQNLAPRQYARLNGGKPAGAAEVARAVHEYRSRYPDKAVIYSAGGSNHGWAALGAGASLAPLPKSADRDLLAAIATMQPVKIAISAGDGEPTAFALGSTEEGYLLSLMSSQPVELDLPAGAYEMRLVDQKTGQAKPTGRVVRSGRIEPPGEGSEFLLWLVPQTQ